MTDPVLPPTTTLPCPMCNDELVEKPEPPPKVCHDDDICDDPFTNSKLPDLTPIPSLVFSLL